MALTFVIISILALIFPSGSLATEELKLTPLIKSGELDKARERALNNLNFTGVKSTFSKPIASYSGFLTINEATNSNLFFWLIPAIENPATAPVILVMNAIMGTSILQSIFLETGPFSINDKLELKERKTTWARTHTLIYIDAPVGTGFSFTDNEQSYVSTAQEDDEEVYEALKQIYMLFPQLKARALYIAGSGYAGRVIPRLVKTLREKSVKEKWEINLKGIILGSPFVSPKLQIQYSDVYLEMGVIDQAQSKLFAVEERKMRDLIDSNKYVQAAEQSYKIHLLPGSMSTKLTGFSAPFSFLRTQASPGFSLLENFIESKEVHNYLHVGLHRCHFQNRNVFSKFGADVGHTDVNVLAEAANSGIKILIYAPQFDMLIPRVSVERVIQALDWRGKKAHEAAERKVWKVDKEVAGYVKTGGNLTYLMLRDSGFWAAMDQPKWTHKMIKDFTSGLFH